jgi:hypothetical protein
MECHAVDFPQPAEQPESTSDDTQEGVGSLQRMLERE